MFLANGRANFISVEGFLRNFYSNFQTLFLKMKSLYEYQGEKWWSVINIVFVGDCILIIFWRKEFRSARI